MSEIYNKQKAMEAQKKMCLEKGWPHFAPERTGRCYSCNREIYEPIEHDRKDWETGGSCWQVHNRNYS